MEPVRELINREIPDNIKIILNYFSDQLDECANIGSHIITWDMNREKQEEYHIPGTMQLRHLIELIDGVSILTRQGAGDVIILLARSVFETSLYIEYLISNDQENRGYSFLVHNTILEHTKRMNNGLDLLRELGEVESSQLKMVETLIKEKLDLLCLDPYKEIYDQNKKPKRRHWYSYFNGPENIFHLSKHLGQTQLYLNLYGPWSSSVHGGLDTILGKIKVNEAEMEGGIYQIRLLTNVQELVIQTINMALNTYSKYIRFRCKDKTNEYLEWKEKYKIDFEKLKSKKLINVRY
jgi:hypothetical protein